MPDPPPCSSYATGAIDQIGLVTSGLTKDGWEVGGSLSASISGEVSPSGCSPYRSHFHWYIEYSMHIIISDFANKDDHNPTIGSTNFPQTLDLGQGDGAGGIGNASPFALSSGAVAVTLGGGGTPPIDFLAIFNGLEAYQSDPVPTVPNVPYTTYELSTVVFHPRVDAWIGHGTPFAGDASDNEIGDAEYLPA